jgi:5-formyltetrahydrofolate cyclo-ligase
MISLDDKKTALRNEASRVRKKAFAATPDAGARLASNIAAHATELNLEGGLKIVSAFWSMGSEIDTAPLLEMLLAAGHTVGLPVVVRNAEPLVFRKWKYGDALIDGGFGTSIPSPDAAEVTPEILIVPLLAYDDTGYRLGYGGGFYDRTLENLSREFKPVTIGIAFAAQRVDNVPRDQHDRCLDWIATEEGLIQTGTL